MRRYRKSVWESTLTSFFISVLFGLLCGFLSCIVLSGISFFVLRGMMFAKLFNLLTLCISGCTSAYICGKYRRRRGLIDGTICGGAIYLVLLMISLFFGEFTSLRKLLLLALSGAAGGISGVNSPRPKNLMY